MAMMAQNIGLYQGEDWAGMVTAKLVASSSPFQQR
jgi:hypothetical protein